MNKFVILASLIGFFSQCDTHQLTPEPETGVLNAGAREMADQYPIKTTLNVAYGNSTNDQGGLQTHTLDIYQPDNDSRQTRPVIVLIHGGSFTSGNKNDMASYGKLYAQHGFVAVSMNYRLSTKKIKFDPFDANYAAALDNAKEDAFGAIRWLRANAAQLRIDKGRIGILGYSAGAATALSVNFDQKTQRKENSAAPNNSTSISTIVEIAGLADSRLIGPAGKPLRMIHGVNDPGVKIQYATVMYKVCQANRVPVVLQTTAGGHDMAPYFPEIASGTLGWFKTYLVDAAPVY